MKLTTCAGHAAPPENASCKLPPKRPRIFDKTSLSSTLNFIRSKVLNGDFVPFSDAALALPISNAFFINFLRSGGAVSIRLWTPSNTFLYNVGTENKFVGLTSCRSSKIKGTPLQTPMDAPEDMSDHNSHVCPYECAHGKNDRDRSDSLINSLGSSTKLLVAPFTLEQKFSFVNSTPFGLPVVPLVYMSPAKSSETGLTISEPLSSISLRESAVWKA
mmetsp:Transcript_60352/g.67486  ORF Transcript_60352/g.67486 Transcript_60352/m.67486 type:complete len:217 (+) Transcript_60352:2345-2995(+)